MANYTPFYDFTAKDALATGDANKLILGSEVDFELDAIETSVATKSNTASPTFTGTVTLPTVSISGSTLSGDATFSGDIEFDGQVILAKGADIASATGLSPGTDGNYFDVTGTTTIATIDTLGIGTVIKLHFDGALSLTHSADLVLPTAADITTAAGDEAEFVEYASADWRCTSYTPASGTLMSHDHSTGAGGALTESAITTPTTGSSYRHHDIGITVVGGADSGTLAKTACPVITVQRTGLYEMEFVMYSEGAGTVGARVYRDASTAYSGMVAFGTDQSTTGTTPTTKTQTSVSLNAGDVLHLYSHGDGSAQQCFLHSFRIQSAVKPFG